jgi:hypothetical protein
MPYDDYGQWYDSRREPWRRYTEEDDPRGDPENWEDGGYYHPPNPDFFYQTIHLPEGTKIAKQTEKAWLIRMPGSQPDVWIPKMKNAMNKPILHGTDGDLISIDLPAWLYREKIPLFNQKPNTEPFPEFLDFER